MWDCVVIGKGEKGCFATKVFNYNNISENTNCFWISSVFIYRGMTIFKNTDAGKQLEKLMLASTPEKEILEWLQLQFIKNASPEMILDIISDTSSQQYKQGADDKVREIQKVLGM